MLRQCESSACERLASVSEGNLSDGWRPRWNCCSWARGGVIRLGSYGDPAAVPLELWRALVSRSSGHTGYTHQWRNCDPGFSDLVMASADSPAERILARARGYRVFRVRTESEPVEEREVVCPASAEAGKKTVCALCRACGGTSSKARADVVIAAHGIGRNVFNIQSRTGVTP